MSADQRRSISNGIWLCENCAKLIDTDEIRYSSALLLQWRTDAEARARQALGKGHADSTSRRHDEPVEFRVHDVGVTRRGDQIAFNFEFRHDSSRAAHDVQISILLWRCSLSGGYTDTRSFTSANPVPRNVVVSSTLSFALHKPDVEPHFVIVSIVASARGATKHEQLFFYKWAGVQAGTAALELTHASREERRIIDARHDALQNWIAKLPGSLPLALYPPGMLKTERQKVIAECVQNCAAVLKNENIIPFNALARVEGYRLHSNDELISVCSDLEQHGFGNPLSVIAEWVPQPDWLDFLRHVQLDANVDAAKGFDWLLAAETWRRAHGYPKPPGLPLA